ncbi:hypothetical protein KAR34_10110 [bacterium]|nr:hypothetical protein [bacterium]
MNLSQTVQKTTVLLFFVVLFIVGLVIVKDYGLSIAEPTQRRYGEINWNYIFAGDQRLVTYKDNIYGPAFELFLFGAEKILHLKDTQHKYLLRHTLNFLLFFTAVWFFYLFCKHHFRHWGWGILGALLLILSPRIFAHAFFNSKDLPFLCLFIISMYTLQQYLDKKNWWWVIGHALSCALVVDIRVLGLLVPMFTSLLQGWDIYVVRQDRKQWIMEGSRLLVYGLLFFVLMILFWPTLWKQPLANLVLALKEMSRFPWLGEMLYLGKMVKSDALPWHYAPVWIFITTPILYSLGFILGLLVFTKELIKQPLWVLRNRKMDVIFLLWFFLPLGAVILFRSVLYNGWRHLYFIYPAMLLIAIQGGKSAYLWLKSKISKQRISILTWTFISLLACYLMCVLLTMVRMHPNQHLFFQQGIGGIQGAHGKFALDYWGLTFYHGLQTLLAQEDAKMIKVYETDPVLADSARLLPRAARQRLVFIKELDRAQYYLDNGFRALPADYPHVITHALLVGQVRVLTIAKLENQCLSWEQEQEQARVSLLTKNMEITQDKSISQVFYTLENNIRSGLAKYVRNTEDLQIFMEPFSTEKIRCGEFEQLRIRAIGGELGDFQHQDLGLPFEVLDITISQLVLDLEAAQKHRLEIISLGSLVVNEIELQDQKVNQALAKAKGDERKLRLFFKEGMIQARWLDKPQAEVDVALEVKPDTIHTQSDNLWFEIKRITIARVLIPKTLVHWGLQDYNPLIPMEKIPGQVKLGEVKITEGKLRFQ